MLLVLDEQEQPDQITDNWDLVVMNGFMATSSHFIFPCSALSINVLQELVQIMLWESYYNLMASITPVTPQS